MNENKSLIKKADIILVIALLLLAVFSYFFIELFVKKDGAMVEITVDGQILGEYALDEDRTISVYPDDSAIVIIDEGSVYMFHSDCPDKICVDTGRISKTGETIVCLPKKIVVEVKGNDNELDGVVQ